MALTDFINKLLSEQQIRTVGILSSGVIISQLAILLATPLLTRLYTPEEIGIFAILMAILSTLAPVAALRLELSIPIPREETEAWHTFILSILTALAFASLLTAIISFSPNWAAALVGLPNEISWALWVIPISLLLSGLQQSLSYWNIRNSQFLRVSQSRGGYGVAAAGSQTALGSAGAGVEGLVLGEITGRMFACIWLAIKPLQHSPRERHPTISARILLAVLGKFRKFILISTPSSFVNALSIHLPILAIGHILGAYYAGLLMLAQRIVGLPTTLLVSPISQTFIAEFAQKKTASQRVDLFKDTIKRFALLTGPLFLIAVLVSPILFTHLFGEEWGQSGLLAAVLAPFYFVQLLSGSTVSALEILQAHWFRLGREIFFLAGTTTILVVGYIYELSLFTMVSSYAGFGTLFYTLSLFWTYRIIIKSENQ